MTALTLRERLAAALLYRREINQPPDERWNPETCWTLDWSVRDRVEALADVDILLAELRAVDEDLKGWLEHQMEHGHAPDGVAVEMHPTYADGRYAAFSATLSHLSVLINARAAETSTVALSIPTLTEDEVQTLDGDPLFRPK